MLRFLWQKTIKKFVPSKAALIIQQYLLALLTFPALLNLFILIFNPNEPSLPSNREGLWLFSILTPLGLISTVFARRKKLWAEVVAVSATCIMTGIFMSTIISAWREPTDNYFAGLALQVFVPLALTSLALVLLHIHSIWKSNARTK